MLTHIAKNGSLVDPQVIYSSGNKQVDNISLEAVRKASPFPALPTNYPLENILYLFSPLSIDTDMQMYKDWDTDSLTLAPYLANLQKTIKSDWRPPLNLVNNQIATRCYISKGGQLIYAWIIRSNADSASNQAALDAIKTSVPFAPFPPEYQKSFIGTEFTFDYHVYSLIPNINFSK